jgi:hypothetical protein
LQPIQGAEHCGACPDTNEITRLFNPRIDLWPDHFQFDGPRLAGRTSIGRITIDVLAMNANNLLSIRAELLAEGA